MNTSQPIDARLEPIIEAAIVRLQGGEPVDLEGLVAAHPEHEQQLRELLPIVETMMQLGATASETGGLPPSPSPSRPRGGENETHQQQLGDFRIVREIGRGGMGVVYEAEQMSLGRRVALKVLPFAAMLDRQQLARFKNEARAAATLDHPNIVAIYSVGCERSVHYYAMQLIEGRSLAEIIEQMKSGRPPLGEETAPEASLENHPTDDDTAKAALPTVQATGSASFATTSPVKSREFHRSVARLGIQAAEALDHAHQNGILHRDIKPANLLVDDAGKLWITDFGLARMEVDAGLTMTGDLLGTLRYMSPEQALATRVIIDHRCDVYSLGATLYELLTMQPAFAETDRARLLHHIAFEEPRPLRKVNGQIPVELETIVLKAMAKQREERYQTAEQLADDLQAYLDHRPIKAKPPKLAQRAVKWSRRHQTIVYTAAVALVLLSAVLGVSMVRVQGAKTQAIAALNETADLLYMTDMRMAYQAFEKGWSDEVQAILDRQRPQAGQTDRRGAEWHLLQKLVAQPVSFALSGHEGPVNEIAVFPDGRRLASVGNDGTLRVWDLAARRIAWSLRICSDELHSVAISPDGRYIVVGSSVVYLIDTRQSNRVTDLFTNKYTVESLAFSPDGNSIAVGTRYDQVCVIKRDGQMVKRIKSTARMESLEFFPNDSSLVIPNSKDVGDREKLRVAELWRGDLSERLKVFEGPRERRPANITVVRRSPTGDYIAAGEERRARARIFDVSNGDLVAETPVSRDWLKDLAYSPDGKTIAIGYRNGQAELFLIRLNEEERPTILGKPIVLTAHRGEVKCMRFVDSSTLATCGTDGQIRIWHVSQVEAPSLDLVDGKLTSMAMSPDGRRLLLASKKEFVIHDIAENVTVCRHSSDTAGYWGAAWTPSGNRAAVGSSNRESVIVSDASGRVLCEVPQAPPLSGFCFSPDETRIAIAGGTSLHVADLATGSLLYRRTLPVRCSVVAYSHDGTQIACGGLGGWIGFFDAQTLSLQKSVAFGSDVECIAFSPIDNKFVSGHGDSTIRIWDAQSYEVIGELVGHERQIKSVAFSSDGRTLLSSACDGTARAWSMAHEREFGILHRRSFDSEFELHCHLQVSKDFKYLALGYDYYRNDSPELVFWPTSSHSNGDR